MKFKLVFFLFFTFGPTWAMDVVFTGLGLSDGNIITKKRLIESLPLKYQDYDWKLEVLDQEGWSVSATVEGLNLSQAQAWDLTYKLRKKYYYVDPILNPSEQEIQKQLKAQQKSVLSSKCDIPSSQRSKYKYNGKSLCHFKASDDFQWAPKQIGLFKAREYSKAKGQDIVIGHPDSGYYPHGEMMASWDLKRAKNFDGKSKSALDTLNSYTTGHGTGTSSVMASPSGRQIYRFSNYHKAVYGERPSSAPYVEGIAPESTVIPYRVHNGSVVRWHFIQETKAIYQAVRDNVDVVSMSLGGPLPRPWFQRALQAAEKAGIIIVAASGNYIPEFFFKSFTVWPAHYPEVIAVAGTNANAESWTGTSRGRRVDIAAPARDVWSATVTPTKSGVNTGVARGDGTSFATAITAGAASMFLSHHGKEELVSKYGRHNMNKLFRYMLTEYGHIRPKNWDYVRMGPGILNVEKLIKAPLPLPSVLNKWRRSTRGIYQLDSFKQISDFYPKASKYWTAKALEKIFMVKGFQVAATYLAESGDEILSLLSSDKNLRYHYYKAITAKWGRRWYRALRFRKELKKRSISPKLRSALKVFKF